MILVSCNESQRGKDYIKPTKNVILMVPDGTSTSILALSKWYMRYMGDEDFELSLKDHMCGMMSSTMSNGIIPCSAAAMSAIVTGMPQRSGNVSIYPVPHPGQDIIPVDSTKTYHPLATVMEAARLMNGAATGIVVTTQFHHATPASCVSHTPKRGDTKAIARQMASNELDVVFGSGSKALDNKVREILEQNGTTLLENDLIGFRGFEGENPIWAIFGERDMPYDIDRDTTAYPSLAEMTAKAIDILSKKPNGFFLLVEGSCIDFAAHANDPNATITEFLAFDKAVGVAMDFAMKDVNTTVVVVPDHGTAGITACNPGIKGGYTKRGIDYIFGDIKGYKATYQKLHKILSECSPEEMKPTFKEWTGIDLDDEELNSLLATSGKQETDYMLVANSENFESAISAILTSHTHMTFANGFHTPEDVFLAVYHPKGHIPQGILTNTELNEYLCKVCGLDKSLEEITEEYFVRHDTLLDGYNYESAGDKDNPVLRIQTTSGEVEIPAWENTFTKAGEQYELPIATVYIKENKKFYLPKQILELL